MRTGVAALVRAAMTIAVGVVFHAVAGEPPIDSTPGIDVLVRTNAGRGGAGGARTPWLGFGANHNLLIGEAAGAEWYVAANPDLALDADDVKRLVEAADGADFDVVSPLIHASYGLAGRPQRNLPGPAQWLRETVGAGAVAPPSATAVTQSAWVPGTCMAIRLDRPEARFDESYFLYFEDVSLCRSVAKAGGRVGVVEGLTVAHRSGWSGPDPLRWRRGVEFARSALRFAAESGQAPPLMRAAGLVRFGSRRLIPGRSPAERVAARTIARGFAQVRRAPGLSELAADFNAAVAR